MKLDLLAFGAHPDDVELFAGGTVAKMSSLGYATGIVDMTRGELGSRGTPAIRAREAAEAGKILGVRARENLSFPDGSIPVTPAARLKVVRVIRKYRPLLVLVHHWDDKHPDHTATCRLVEEASHHAGLAKIDTGQERHRPTTLLYYKLPADVLPSIVVDISDFIEQRLSAIRAHRSQLFDASSTEPSTYLSQPDFLARVDSVQAHYGNLIGRHRGEGFLVKGSLEVSDPVAFFRQHEEIRRR
jgi:N-acetylglucosamine malate deacetylase 1